MRIEETSVAGRRCLVCAAEAPRCLLIQPVGADNPQGLGRQAERLRRAAGAGFALAAFAVDDWNAELSPWDAPAVFGDAGFGHGAAQTLEFVERALRPAMLARWALPGRAPTVIGGYSLAGLFALWAACRTDAFAAVAAASPSVWFPGWLEFARSNATRARAVYLSLGDREERARNPVLASVGEGVRATRDIARATVGEVNCTLVWNPGNHFTQPDARCADAFAWCVGRVAGD